ncbi:signal peptidase I [Zafaria sp. Z1313]|uniref:signal peptidase I n=1 Tax=Zafaria sp. Z1313 TaxID=3423202 RepID=UPI003D303A10
MPTTAPTPALPSPLRAAATAASFLALVLAALAALVLVIVPLATGSQSYSVLTGSMAPHYAPGTLLVVGPADFASLGTGDVVTYQLESGRPEVVTHRIVSVTSAQDGERLLITQGDNNDAPDPAPVAEVQVRGTLLYAVPYAGFAANWLGNQDRTLAGRLLAYGLIGYGAVVFGRGAWTRLQPAVGGLP